MSAIKKLTRSQQKDLITYLKDFVTEDRWETLNRVLNQRTRHLCVVLEDIYQPHNASAVLRSCDCFGVQDVHIIENEHNFSPSKSVTIGADQWLSIEKHDAKEAANTEACFTQLRERGYHIIATTPHRNEVTIDELPVGPQTALVFGAELKGLSDKAMEMADGFVKVPIYGFSESYNVSVSAALCLYEFTKRMRASGVGWKISEEEQMKLQLDWLKKSIRASEQLVERFFEEEGD